jgi:hypothetical protein
MKLRFSWILKMIRKRLVNETDEMGYSAVYAASARNDLKMLKILIDADWSFFQSFWLSHKEEDIHTCRA